MTYTLTEKYLPSDEQFNSAEFEILQKLASNYPIFTDYSLFQYIQEQYPNLILKTIPSYDDYLTRGSEKIIFRQAKFVLKFIKVFQSQKVKVPLFNELLNLVWGNYLFSTRYSVSLVGFFLHRNIVYLIVKQPYVMKISTPSIDTQLLIESYLRKKFPLSSIQVIGDESIRFDNIVIEDLHNGNIVGNLDFFIYDFDITQRDSSYEN